jgi:hypothetical protein
MMMLLVMLPSWAEVVRKLAFSGSAAPGRPRLFDGLDGFAGGLVALPVPLLTLPAAHGRKELPLVSCRPGVGKLLAGSLILPGSVACLAGCPVNHRARL